MKYLGGTISLLAAVGLSTAGLAYLAGCKGNSAPASHAEASSPPPVLRAPVAATDLLNVSPFEDGAWHNASWITLGSGLRDTRTPPPTHVASFYGSNCLYVAFVCVSPSPATGAKAPPAATRLESGTLEQDRAEIWLDTSNAQNGTEVLSIVVTSTGQVQPSWYRASLPPEPKADGSPNLQYPISQIPNYQIPGLEVRNSRGTLDGQLAWGTVVAIPFQGLPIPLRVNPAQVKPGSHWRINLIRADFLKRDDQSREVLQANLAPVYPACQQVSPYRMTQLLLEGGNAAVALTPPTPAVSAGN